jgi:hypothetical protein
LLFFLAFFSSPFLCDQSGRSVSPSHGWRKMAASAVLTLSPKAIGPFLTLIFSFQPSYFLYPPFFASTALWLHISLLPHVHMWVHGSQLAARMKSKTLCPSCTE